MNPLYHTGLTEHGDCLLGGVWRLKSQEGFPLECSYLLVKDRPYLHIDWLEAMLDASRTNECPALMAELETFLTSEEVLSLKLRFVAITRSGKTYEELYEEKRASGKALNRTWLAVESAVASLRKIS